MTVPSSTLQSAPNRERTLDDLKMTNSSREHDDGKVLRFLIENEEKLIVDGIRRYDAITK